MRFIALAIILSACRVEPATTIVAASPEGELGAEKASAPTPTMLATSSQLPACNPESENQLFYVLDIKKFVVCDATDWVEIEIKGENGVDGVAGADGTKITSIKVISSTNTNLCSTRECYFNGGQLVTMSDDNKSITATSTRVNSTPNPPEVDTFNSNFIVPKVSTLFYSRVLTSVTRNNVTANIYIRYFRNPEKVLLVFDTNANNIPEDTDEVVFAPTLEEFK